MARWLCGRVLVSGLCLYICCIVYFLLSIIQVNNTEIEIELVTEKSSLDVDKVKFRVTRAGGKYEIRNFVEIENNEIEKSERIKTPRPTKPPRWKNSKADIISKRYRKPSILHQNFSLIHPEVFVFSAFLDSRYSVRYIRLTVVAPSGRKKIPSGLFCVFNNQEKTELIYYETCENHLRRYAYYVMSCEVPASQIKTFMDITALAIAPTLDASLDKYKFITVINNHGLWTSDNLVMGEFAVCIPPLFGKINVLRLVEFIELTRLLGSRHFTFYTYNVDEDVMKVLQYYKSLGIVTILPWNIPVSNIWYNGQSAAVGDCLLRNMHVNEVVSFNDIDEFIMPHSSKDWKSLIQHTHKQSTTNVSNIAVYRFQSAFFVPQGEKRKRNATSNRSYDSYMMDKFVSLSSTSRTKRFSNLRTKMMAYPLKVFELGIHHLSKQAQEEFYCHNVQPEIAFLHHYRKCDPAYGTSCSPMIEDNTTLHYKNDLVNNTVRTLRNLKNLK